MDCDAVIVYWGKAKESWFRTQMSEIQRGVGWRQGKPMKASAVYLAGPETDEKEDFTSHGIVLKNYGEFSAETLSPFLAQLGTRTGRHTE
jgi:hypothetical protein